jgi:hypothetical protein
VTNTPASDDVIATLRSYGIEVDRDTAATLADEARERAAQTARLLDYDLPGVDSAVELSRRGRR